MERRNFFITSAILGSMSAMFPSELFATNPDLKEKPGIEPLLLPAMPPLNHNGGMDIYHHLITTWSWMNLCML
ncbi:MAG: hypothetical protein IPH45_13670 [Bacteroidales bacterium]|nr:hypothetical protein [Bacteroidales bacterium]